MPLLDPPAYGGWGYFQNLKRVTLKVDLGYSGVYYVPWLARATTPLVRVAARIKALNYDHVLFATSGGAKGKAIPGRAAGLAGVYKVTQFGTWAIRDATCCPGQWSNHSWPLAADINWLTNPFHGTTNTWGPHDMPEYFQTAFAMEGFHWLAAFDPMHFERLQIDGQIVPEGQAGLTSYDYTEFTVVDEGGFLMALTDAQQAEMYADVKRMDLFLDGLIDFTDLKPDDDDPKTAGQEVARDLNFLRGQRIRRYSGPGSRPTGPKSYTQMGWDSEDALMALAAGAAPAAPPAPNP